MRKIKIALLLAILIISSVIMVTGCKQLCTDATHIWDTTKTQIKEEPTCTSAGARVETCSICGATKEFAIPAIDHTFDGVFVHDEETHRSTCDMCDQTVYDNHVYGSGTIVSEVSCGVDGRTEYTCVCGHKKVVITQATGLHDWNEGYVIEDSTHAKTCKNCDFSLVEDHVPVEDEAVDATCTTDGKTSGVHCSVCEKVIVAQETIPALTHDYKCFSDETDHWLVCQREECGHTTEKAVHVWDEGKVTTDPTCTETGVRTHTCTFEGCGKTKTEVEPAQGLHCSS